MCWSQSGAGVGETLACASFLQLWLLSCLAPVECHDVVLGMYVFSDIRVRESRTVWPPSGPGATGYLGEGLVEEAVWWLWPRRG